MIAHRGASRQRRENTLDAFALALAQGADAIELDVHATRDGIVVVHHDALLRAGAVLRPIVQMTAAEVRAAAGASRHRAPELAEVLSLVGGRATVYVELKGADVAERAVETIARCGAGAWTRVHAFDHRQVLAAATLAPEVERGILLGSRLVDTVAAMRSARASHLWQEWESVDPALIAAVHDAGGRVIAWTVNDAAHALQLARLGVDGICTDCVLPVRQALARER